MWKRIIVVIFLTEVLSSCVSFYAEKHYWTRPGWTQSQFSTSDLECQAMAKSLGSHSPYGEDPRWISCMQSKDWVIQKTEKIVRPLF